MRISDWSSDVCSSDLIGADEEIDRHAQRDEQDDHGEQQPEIFGTHRLGEARTDLCAGDAAEQQQAGENEVDRAGRHRMDHRRRDGDEQYLERSEEHTSELQSLMRISYAVFCLNKKTQ